jgi:hypothetical protein
MTLTDRSALIDRVVRHVERAYPCMAPGAVFEVAVATLARDHGLTVTPDEIVRVLSQLAEAAP